MSKQPYRPVFLNLLQIKLPPAGLASIAHRISGLLLVLSAPLFIYLFALSLQHAAGFQSVQEIMSCWWFKGLLVLLCWSIAHHLLAGVRFLLLDMDIGMSRDVLNKTAWVVMLLGLVLGFVLALRLL